MLIPTIRSVLLSVLPVLFCTCNGCNFSLISGTTTITPAAEVVNPRFLDSAHIAYILLEYDLKEISGGLGEYVREPENLRHSLVIRNFISGKIDTTIDLPITSTKDLSPHITYCPPVLLVSLNGGNTESSYCWYFNIETRTTGTYPFGYASLANSPDTVFSVRSLISLSNRTVLFSFDDSVRQIIWFNAKNRTAIMNMYSENPELQNRHYCGFAAFDSGAGIFTMQKMPAEAGTGQVVDNSQYLFFKMCGDDTAPCIVSVDSLDAALSHRRTVSIRHAEQLLFGDARVNDELVLFADSCCYVTSFNGDTVAGPFCP